MKISGMAAFTALVALVASSVQAQVTNGFNNGPNFVSTTVTIGDLTLSPPTDNAAEVTTSGAFSSTAGVSGTFAWTVNAWASFDTGLFTGTPSAVAQSSTGWGITNGNANLASSLGEALTFAFNLSDLTLSGNQLMLKGFSLTGMDTSESYNVYRFDGVSSTLLVNGAGPAAFGAVNAAISNGDILSISGGASSAFRVPNMVLDIVAIPEPSAGALVVLAGSGFWLLRRRRTR